MISNPAWDKNKQYFVNKKPKYLQLDDTLAIYTIRQAYNPHGYIAETRNLANYWLEKAQFITQEPQEN